MPQYLITGATGNQGSGAVTHLLTAGHTVHALVRNLSSPAAQALAARGVKLFEGTFSSVPALTAAATECDGIFILSVPSFGSLTQELEDGQNMIAAAKAAGVKHAIYSSVAGLTTPEERGIEPGNFFHAYWANKVAIEEAVKTAGFERWTLLRPGGFVTNFLLPGSAFMAPDLSTKGLLQTALKPDLVCPWVVPSDVGKFAAAAFARPEDFHGQIVEIAVEKFTMAEYLAILGKVAGKKIGIRYWSSADVEAMGGQNPIAISQLKQNNHPETPDLDKVRSWGVPMVTVEEFFRDNTQRVVESVGGN